LLHLGNYLGLLYHIPQSKGNNRIIFTRKGKAAMLLRVVGWVMAMLQAALAVQYLFNSLVRIAALHPFSP
jgi:hypothetical protein